MDLNLAMTISDPLINKVAATGTKVGGYNDFARGVRSAVRGLWSGTLDRFSFIDSMVFTVDRGLRRAWYEGAAQCGINPDELTITELDAMRDLINSQFVYIMGFADDISTHGRGIGLLSTQFARAELWINRYNQATNKGRTMACADKKMIWLMGVREKHCRTCNALHGKVKRNSVWLAAGVEPQNAPNPMLECEGWNCGCSRTVTDLPVSRGPLPRMP